MNNIKILPLIIDLVGSFFRSSRDALERAICAQCRTNTQGDNDSNLFQVNKAESQAAIESIIFSFFTIEAIINYLFYEELRGRQHKNMEKWLQDKWKRNISIFDRFILLVDQYTSANLDNYQYLTMLFREYISFRNRIVHAMPDQYDALVEEISDEGEVLLHDIDFHNRSEKESSSCLSAEIGKITCEDAKRCFEIMLLIICFLDEQFISDLEFPLKNKEGDLIYMRPREIIASLTHRFYPKLIAEQFKREEVKEILNPKKEQ